MSLDEDFIKSEGERLYSNERQDKDKDKDNNNYKNKKIIKFKKIKFFIALNIIFLYK